MTKPATGQPRWAERSLLHRGGRTATWGSLGLWRDDTADYAAACADLARAVARAAGLRRGERVLSVACGAGDELLLLSQEFGAAEVVGVEADPELQAAAQQLATATGARVLPGSATALEQLGLPAGGFDRVLCVDAAYHLRPRRAFLQGALALLRPGGTLAYTELVVAGAALAFKRAMLVPGALMCGVPVAELQAVATLPARLQALGFEAVQVQRLDDEVLGGFASFVWQQGSELGAQVLSRAWKRPAYTAGLIKLARPFGLGYALVAATRPAGAAGATPAPASMASATA